MKRLYARIFFWFCVANAATWAISIFVVSHIAHDHAPGQPDWRSISHDAVALYASGGAQAVSIWRQTLRHRGIDIALMGQGRNLLGEPLPPAMQAQLPRLMSGPEVMLNPAPEMTLAGFDVEGPLHQHWRFLASRRLRPHWGLGRGPGPALPIAIEIVTSLLVIGFVGLFISRSIGRPVEQMQRVARRMAQGDLAARVGTPLTSAPDELGQLARDFDYMAARIESSVERNRSLLRDLSHELRSPLARLQLALELGRGGLPPESSPHWQRADREIARLDRLIGEMLELVRVEGGLQEGALAPIDLAELARERVEEARLEADRKRLRLAVTGDAGIEVRGHRRLLGRAFDNALSNAIKFSPEGAEIAVRIARHGGDATVCIEDHGPGVPEDELARLFTPFFRGSNGVHAEGHGLGLAIIERIVHTHGGRCAAANRPGGGLQLSMILPPDHAPPAKNPS